jgi:hypothetical protein
LEEGSPGSGTYTRHGYIFSSLAGCLMKTSENGAVKEAATQRAFPLRVPLSSGPWAQAERADASLVAQPQNALVSRL